MAARAFSIPRALLGRIPRHRNLSTLPNASAAVIGMTSLLLLVQISGVASMAYEVQRLEDLRTYWQETNHRLEAEIARLQSLNRVEDEAVSRLKMAPAKETIPVTVARPLPIRPSVPQALPADTPRVSASGPKSWFQEFFDYLTQAMTQR